MFGLKPCTAHCCLYLLTMPKGRLEAVAETFEFESGALLDKFLSTIADAACVGCSSAGLGQAILPAWLQTKWGTFTRELVIASAQGTRRTGGTPVPPAPGVKSRAAAERIVSAASRSAFKSRGLGNPIWHAPLFVIQVGASIGLRNLTTLELALGSSTVPREITDFRNYLFHPGDYTRSKYEELREKLGLVRVEPEDLLRQELQPEQMVFTSWVRELQRVANASVK